MSRPWRRIAGGAVVVSVHLVLDALLGVAAFAALEPPVAVRPEMRLGLPYPITGPREIQAGDRTTRRYRAAER